MKTKFQRLLRKLITHVYLLFGVDWVSRNNIQRRNDLLRIGSKYGGWTVPADLINASSICYCVGCGEDISFDLGLIDRFGSDVYGFDPTPKAITYVEKATEGMSQYHFHRYGLWENSDRLHFYVPRNSNHVSHSILNLQNTSESIILDVKRLSTVMTELGHDNVDLLKIDIEGAEYKVIESVIEDNLDVTIICVEFDEWFNPLDSAYKKRIKNSIDRLVSSGYSIVNSEGNGNYTFHKSHNKPLI
jgi:FkbM family methyltransferase